MRRDILLIFSKTGFDLRNINIQLPMGLYVWAS